jgi:hypothetical protein
MWRSSCLSCTRPPWGWPVSTMAWPSAGPGEYTPGRVRKGPHWAINCFHSPCFLRPKRLSSVGSVAQQGDIWF